MSSYSVRHIRMATLLVSMVSALAAFAADLGDLGPLVVALLLSVASFGMILTGTLGKVVRSEVKNGA